jgi:hypothetical protein
MIIHTHGSKQKLKQIDSDFQLWTKDVSQIIDLHPDALLLIKDLKANFKTSDRGARGRCVLKG